jgi:hypothetical protein
LLLATSWKQVLPNDVRLRPVLARAALVTVPGGGRVKLDIDNAFRAPGRLVIDVDRYGGVGD